MLLVFVEQISERVNYTFDFVFKERKIEYVITNDFVQFERFDGTKLNYSERHFENVVKVSPSNLLFDESIDNYGISKSTFYNEECLSFNDIVDPFASIFYILSRMEEYTTISTDKFGRFEGKNSVLYRFEWNEKVICDRWSIDIINFLNANSCNVGEIEKPNIKVVPTFDIDNAYAYKHKGIIRTAMATLKDFAFGKSKRLLERQKVQTGFMKDPYDTYDRISELSKEGFEVKIFWLLGDFAKYDRNISHRRPKQKKLIQRMSEVATVGIHPSFKSNSYEFYLHNEIERLEDISKKHVYSSRQHFLVLKFPKTYKTLIEQEIKDDYTMGFADIAGFRVGTARAIKWFDLSKNKTTSLTLHPFAFMDGTLNEYLKLTPSEAKEKISNLFKEVSQFGGDFTFIWHNETIGNYGVWKDWSEVFELSVSLKS